ncbi:MAG: cytochrome c [Arcobacteraceae bacterium]
MSSGKIIGLVASLGIVLLLIFMLVQETSTKKAPVVEQKIEQPTPKKTIKTEEEEKLEELKKQASVSTNNSVSQLYSLRCKACHGSEGQGSQVGPSIKGKSVEYILSKLDDYKNNRVTNSLMQGLLTNATQEELNTLAQEISSFK